MQSAPDVPAQPLRDPVWSLWDVLFTAAFAVAASVVIAMLLVGILGLRIEPGAFQPEVMRLFLVGQILAYALAAAFAYSLLVYRYRRPFLPAIQWNWPATPAIFILAGITISVAVMIISRFLPVPKGLPIERYFSDRPLAFLMVFFGTAIAPLVEEVFFRGFLYPVLRKYLGVVLAIAITAASFAVIHGAQVNLAWAPLLMLFCVGLALTIVRERTGSVSAAFLIHLGYNGTLFLLLALATRGFTEAPKVAP